MSRQAGTPNGRAFNPHISAEEVKSRISEQFDMIERMEIVRDIEPDIYGLRVLEALANIRGTVDEAIRAMAISISTDIITTTQIARSADVTPPTIRSWRKHAGLEE